ncbi:FMRFamide-related peptides-like [Achroia grisella]|uniref:FMRFamide-related peptides-like n=1 Tax=Achroia grisella TaxID=688607 RepID=UPI0027D34E31|nr:FMRFamide-related peptides-like [Achroia grisella]
MRSCSRSVAVLAALWLIVGATSTPVRRSPDLEARRRSAIDRSMIRFGRSYPPEISAADIRESLQRPVRRGNSFLRFGRSQPMALSTDDLVSLLKTYGDDYDNAKRSASFIRLGRNPSFIRLGRSPDEDKTGYEQSSELVVSGYPQRKSRARDHFIRLGRDSEELNDRNEFEDEANERTKRAAEVCEDCQA